MIIVLSQRVTKESRYRETRDALSHDWCKFIEDRGGVPVPIPNALNDVSNYVDRLRPKYVILTGGNTVAEADGEAEDCSRERDETERHLLSYAIKNYIPVLGVCRGMQMIQAYFGGVLSRIDGVQNHVASRHEVSLSEDMAVRSGQETGIVNSYHEWGIRQHQVAEQLIPFARCSIDNTIEGFAHTSYPIIGVMWHPEREGSDNRVNHALLNYFFGLSKEG
ncbi:gamma-glutamyl-gamma-aminobutyrate hydrolase family protein [Cohnella yongneupensis]|uniref:Gamma-glutamyl-gamma-aminobutyrate hydrolase family protein n=1 Tax=Cohnella yongneupensis TaxID=425006 RepID=A0ABW0QXT8_9BACL